MSSQPASRCGRGAACGRAASKSGARNGLASCRETTDWGTTRRSSAAGASTGSAGGGSTGSGSIPAARSISVRSARADSDTTASSPRRARSAESRTAVRARIVAMPSSRFSCSARWLGLLASSALTRARSSRATRATAWNFVRTLAVTEPRWTAASTSLHRPGQHRDDVLRPAGTALTAPWGAAGPGLGLPSSSQLLLLERPGTLARRVQEAPAPGGAEIGG
ncbi:hypothetical protein [Blastococcus sp. TML/C7B]|uniref:hypothetical protein n=1 Tax=Blastococcus sp. TML/C7B TaxID=2798728 RepID=UPI001F5B8C02|nr:hypothetical protein [Blastococcus sp. TML/C7B]